MSLRLLSSALLASLAAGSAHAALINASFSGTVVNQSSTSYAVGAPISGSFTYDSTAMSFVSFNVGTFGLPTGAFSSSVPGAFTAIQSAIFSATQSPAGNGSANNTNLTVDLETNGSFNTANLLGFIANPGPGAITTSAADPFPSTFSYTRQTPNGAAVTEVTADLTGFSAVSVPEPGSLGLLVVGLTGLIAAVRRGTA